MWHATSQSRCMAVWIVDGQYVLRRGVVEVSGETVMKAKMVGECIQSIYALKSFVMSNGERYCLLVNRSSGFPIYYPSLFVTSQVRNGSLSYSAMESTIGGITVLLRYMAEKTDDLESRFGQHRFFEIHELDAIRDYCQKKFRVRTKTADSNGMFTLEELRDTDEKVSSHTVYVRLTVISHYVSWLAEFLSGEGRQKEVAVRIAKMAKEIKARRPAKKNRNIGLVEKGLDEKQLEMLFELFRPESDFNPFSVSSVKVRNRLMFLLLYHLGLRGGELLNIRIRDIDFLRNQILVVRRADEKDDPRTDQPLAKTLDRRLPLKDTLVKEIHQYILLDRKQNVRRGQPDYLFVTHKNGPTKGQPLSKSSYKKIMGIVRKVYPALYNFSGHQLRHTWNEQFSKMMDSMDNPPSQEIQEAIRSNLMGWRLGSGTADIYNARFTIEKAHEASLKLQEGLVRMPTELCNE